MSASIKSSIFSVLPILTLAACNDTSPQQQPPAQAPQDQAKCLTFESPGLTYTPTWTNSVGSIFANNCQSCHGTMFSNYNYVQANNYSIMGRINSGNMPQGRMMTQLDKSTLQQWVSSGMPFQANATPQPSPFPAPIPTTNPTTPTTPTASDCVPTGTSVSFARDIQPIMQKYCVSCHSAAGGRIPYLDTYTNVKSSYSAALQDVTTGRMPAGTSNKVPSDKITLLKNWGSSNFSQ